MVKTEKYQIINVYNPLVLLEGRKMKIGEKPKFTCIVDKSVVEEKGLVRVTGRERGLEKRDEGAAPENGSWGKRCLKRICTQGTILSIL